MKDLYFPCTDFLSSGYVMCKLMTVNATGDAGATYHAMATCDMRLQHDS
jgi:hypothetical protein